MRRHLWLAVAAAVAGPVIVAVPAAASGGPEAASTAARAPAPGAAFPYGMDRLTYERMMAQIPLDEAATRIQLAAARPGAGHGGFFQTWVDDDHHLLTVVWHGAVPPDIARLIGRLRHQVRIAIVPAAYSLGRLDAALHLAMRLPGVISGYPRDDGSGLVVGVRAGSAAARPAALARFATGLTRRLGVPVRVVPSWSREQSVCGPGFYPIDQANALPAPSRCDDRSPGFWGGNVIYNITSPDLCSTAFGVHDSHGNGYMVTAAHCSHDANGNIVNGVRFDNGDKTQFMGSTIDAPGPHDAALIPTSSGNRYYDGPGVESRCLCAPGPDTHNTKIVLNQLGVSKGDWLCESGAFGGVICQLQVFDVGVAANGFYDLALAQPMTGQYTIDGDSGGPFFALTGVPGKVSARGVIDGIASIGGPVGDAFTPMSIVGQDTGTYVNTG